MPQKQHATVKRGTPTCERLSADWFTDQKVNACAARWKATDLGLSWIPACGQTAHWEYEPYNGHILGVLCGKRVAQLGGS